MLFKHRTWAALGLVFSLAPTPLLAAETEDDDTTEVVFVISNRLPTPSNDSNPSLIDRNGISISRPTVTAAKAFRA